MNEVQIYLTCKINHIRRQRQRQTLNICNFITGILPIYLSAWSPVFYLGGVGIPFFGSWILFFRSNRVPDHMIWWIFRYWDSVGMRVYRVLCCLTVSRDAKKIQKYYSYRLINITGKKKGDCVSLIPKPDLLVIVLISVEPNSSLSSILTLTMFLSFL